MRWIFSKKRNKDKPGRFPSTLLGFWQWTWVFYIWKHLKERFPPKRLRFKVKTSNFTRFPKECIYLRFRFYGIEVLKDGSKLEEKGKLACIPPPLPIPRSCLNDLILGLKYTYFFGLFSFLSTKWKWGLDRGQLVLTDFQLDNLFLNETWKSKAIATITY